MAEFQSTKEKRKVLRDTWFFATTGAEPETVIPLEEGAELIQNSIKDNRDFYEDLVGMFSSYQNIISGLATYYPLVALKLGNQKCVADVISTDSPIESRGPINLWTSPPALPAVSDLSSEEVVSEILFIMRKKIEEGGFGHGSLGGQETWNQIETQSREVVLDGILRDHLEFMRLIT